jgi:hypothetical protein
MNCYLFTKLEKLRVCSIEAGPRLECLILIMVFLSFFLASCSQETLNIPTPTETQIESIDKTEIPKTTDSPTFTPTSAEAQSLPATATESPVPSRTQFRPTYPSIIATEFNNPSPIYERKDVGHIAVYAVLNDPDIESSFLDLDNGYRSAENGDIKFSVSSNGVIRISLEMINGARSARVDENAGFEVCKELQNTFSSETLNLKAEIGNLFCMLTSENRLSIVHLESVGSSDEIYLLAINFITWKRTDE